MDMVTQGRQAIADRIIAADVRRADRLLEAMERHYVEEWQRASLEADPEYVWFLEQRLADLIDAQRLGGECQ